MSRHNCNEHNCNEHIRPIFDKSHVTARFGPGQNVISDTSNTVRIDVIDVDIEKFANKSRVIVGEEVTFTIAIHNESSLPLSNVIIKDHLPDGLELVPGSIHPHPKPGESLSKGISIGGITSGGNAALTFKAIVTCHSHSVTCNHATAICSYIDADGRTAVTEVTSEPVCIHIDRPGLEIFESTDTHTITHNGQVVTFTVVVTDTGNLPLEHVVVTDELPRGLTYVPCSTVIGINPPINANPASGILLGRMTPGESIVVKFSAKYHDID